LRLDHAGLTALLPLVCLYLVDIFLAGFYAVSNEDIGLDFDSETPKCPHSELLLSATTIPPQS
jgi:hypothetical protein